MIAALLLITLPAAALFSGFMSRKLSADTPDLAEQMQAFHGRRTFLALGFTLPGLIFQIMNQDHNAESPPFLTPYFFAGFLLIFYLHFMATNLGSLPMRRRILGEVWTTAQYLRYTLRSAIASQGFWILVVSSPYLVSLSGAWSLGVACVLAVTMLFAFFGQHHLLLALLDAKPLDRPDLCPAFASINEKLVITPPTVYVIGPEKGSLANAFACPHPTRSMVLFTAPLLRHLNPAETAAIYGHETAHLEDFAPGLKPRRLLSGVVLSLISAFVMPLAQTADLNQVALLLWIPLILIALMAKNANHKTKESASDLRAVELCGDPEALISALIKLYALNLAPRRQSREFEKRSTHPSLARRIQDIRRAAAQLRGQDPATAELTDPGRSMPAAPLILKAAAPANEALILDGDRIHWLKGGDLQTHHPFETLIASAQEHLSKTYENLVELRLETHLGKRKLKAVDTLGKVYLFPVQEPDIAALQTALDRVDTRLTASTSVKDPLHRVNRLLCGFAGLCAALTVFQGALSFGVVLWMLVTGVIAMLFPRRALTAACGLICFVFAVSDMVFSPYRDWWQQSVWIFLILTAVLGLVATLRSVRSQPDATHPHQPARTLLFLLMTGGAIWALVIMSLMGPHALDRLHALALEGKAAFVPFIGLAGALMTGRKAATRWSALPLFVLGLSWIFFGSEFFVSRIAKDPFLPHIPVTQANQGAPTLDHSAVLADGWGLKVTPTGTALLIGVDWREVDDLSFQLLTFDGKTTEFDAANAGFVDSHRYWKVTLEEDGAWLRVLSVVDPNPVLWERLLTEHPLAAGYEVVFDGDHWVVANGAHGYAKDVAFFFGAISSNDFEHRTWSDLQGDIHVMMSDKHRLALTRGDVALGSAVDEPRSSWIQASYDTPSRLILHDKPPRLLGRSSRQMVAAGPWRDKVFLQVEGPKHHWFHVLDMATGQINVLAKQASVQDWATEKDRLVVLTRHRALILDMDGRVWDLPFDLENHGQITAAVNGDILVVGQPTPEGKDYRVYHLTKTP